MSAQPVPVASPSAVSAPPLADKGFSPLVRQFLDYLKLERHFSDYTIKSYGADLVQFGQFLSGAIGRMHQSNPTSADTTLSGDQLDQKQVSCEPLAVREFLAYLYGQNYTK